MKSTRRIACLMLILLLCTSVLGCGPSLERENFVPVTKEAHTELPVSSAAPGTTQTEGETAAPAAEEQTRQTETEEPIVTTNAPAETTTEPAETTTEARDTETSVTTSESGSEENSGDGSLPEEASPTRSPETTSPSSSIRIPKNFTSPPAALSKTSRRRTSSISAEPEKSWSVRGTRPAAAVCLPPGAKAEAPPIRRRPTPRIRRRNPAARSAISPIRTQRNFTFPAAPRSAR